MKTLSIGRRAAEYASVFTFGGIMYGAAETVWRGYTHPSMIVVGGLCFSGLYVIDAKNRECEMWKKAVWGALLITAAEFISGCICNLWLGWNVWDYSHIRMNLLGQICMPYTVLWFILSPPAYFLCRLVRRAVGDDGSKVDGAEAETRA